MKCFAAVAALTVIAAATALAGCSGSSSNSATQESSPGPNGAASTAPDMPTADASVDVCSLLTAQQASAIVGVHYTAVHPSRNMCTYTPSDAPIPMYIIVTQKAGGDAAWQEQLATIRSDGGSNVKMISGVGDRAAGAGTEIGVQAGDRIIDVHGGDPDGSKGTFPKSVAVAKALIATLH